MPQGMIRDYVFVEDLVAANLLVLEKGTGGAFNFGTGVSTSTAELYDALAKTIGNNTAPQFGEPRSGDIKRSVLDIAKAKDQLGWEPKVSLAQGCARTMEWYRGGK